MTILVTGGSKCGKSGFAESLLDNCTGPKIYLATMQPYGDEAHAAIARHREMRKQKGFQTVEQYTDLHQLQLPPHSHVLLECIGNLTANEMFRQDPAPDCADHILRGILHIRQQTDSLVIVTNQVGSDGIRYDTETQRYIAVIGTVNQRIAEIADAVYECVWGIPVPLKGVIS